MNFWVTFLSILVLSAPLVALVLTVFAWFSGAKSFRKLVGKRVYGRVIKVSVITAILSALGLALFIQQPLRDTPNYSNYEPTDFEYTDQPLPTEEELEVSREEERKKLFHEVDSAHENRTLDDPNKSIDDAIERANKRDNNE